MKQIIILLLITLGSMTTTSAQNAKQNANGNYTALKQQVEKEKPQPTGRTFTDAKGNVYPVYISAKGKLFYFKISKTGNEYKVYLKLEVPTDIQ